MLGHYVLLGKLAVPCDMMTWARWLEEKSTERVVAQEYVGESYWVSTVFIGLDMSFRNDLPILFETMIFDNGGSGDYQERCGTWEEAIEMHETAVSQAMRWLRQLPVIIERV